MTPSAPGPHARRIRVGVVQLAMRPMSGPEEFFEHASFFLEAMAGYGADFVCFPEYVNAPLMAPWKTEGATAAIRNLAELTAPTLDFFSREAVARRINIITGSLPVIEGDRLYNAVYLCRRDGTMEEQRKIHATPSEESEWQMSGGDRLRVFETDSGKIGILICYDVEFPELGRLLADEGLQILFVPFCTDTASGFHRVRYCAQARAIENECYVVAAGSVGNLPGVANMDFQFARSAVFSPSDYDFPENAIVTEAPAGLETALIADLDLKRLEILHHRGSVRNLRQRRTDLYDLNWRKGSE
ncbi:MAG: carbon-nitrogen hydrolase family protein [Verrucomicrobiae bacterium]|nr:carbon-nitrogen hydrolase family protein [Verrucomicrobiae bacterium]